MMESPLYSHFLASYLHPKWEVLEGFGLLDLLMLPVVVGTIFYFAIFVFLRQESDHLRSYYLKGMALSIGSGLVFAYIYNYVYVGGDTFWYYFYSAWFREAFEDNPIVGLQLFFAAPASDNPAFLKYMAPIGHLYYDRASNEMIFMFKLIGLLESITIPSYWTTTVFFSLFAFSGKWALFRFLSKEYPAATKHLAIAILFIPSVLFWGSGILKDTLCLGSICWIITLLFKAWKNPLKHPSAILWIALHAKILLILKAYLLLAFVGPAALYLYLQHKPNSSILLVKVVALPVAIGIFLIASGALLASLAQSSQKYQLDQLEKRAEGFKNYHTYLARTRGQSFYELGTITYTPLGILQKAPAAFNVTYFRPYLWEVNEPMQIMSALESVVMFMVFLYIVVSNGLWTTLKLIRESPIITCLILYAFVLGVSIGLTAYNFGALVRFKIPGVVALSVALVLLYHEGLRLKAKSELSDDNGIAPIAPEQ